MNLKFILLRWFHSIALSRFGKRRPGTAQTSSDGHLCLPRLVSPSNTGPGLGPMRPAPHHFISLFRSFGVEARSVPR